MIKIRTANERPKINEKPFTLSVWRISLICEYICVVGVITNIKYVGFSCNKIGWPVFSLSPLPKSYTADPPNNLPEKTWR